MHDSCLRGSSVHFNATNNVLVIKIGFAIIGWHCVHIQSPCEIGEKRQSGI